MAYKISNLPATEITHTVLSVAFPALSKIQDSVEKLREAVLRGTRVVSLPAFPIAGGLLAIADNFTHTVLGDKWAPIITLILVLCFQAASRSIRGILGAMVQGIGRPDIETKLTGLQLVIIVVLIYPLSKAFGTLDVALVMSLQTLSTLPVLCKYALPEIELPIREYSEALLFPFLSTALMVSILLVLNLPLPAEIFLGIAIYATLSFLNYKFGVFDRVFVDLQYIKESAGG